MSRSTRLWAGAALMALLAAVLGGALVSAVPETQAAPVPLTWDCDTPGARLSELTQVQRGPSYRIGGRVGARELRADARWPSVATILVESADEQDRIMIEVTARSRTDEALALSLRTIHGLDNRVIPLGQAPIGEALPFSLVVADGKARIEIGGFRREVPAEVGPGATVGAGCSTGSFRFEQLTFQH